MISNLFGRDFYYIFKFTDPLLGPTEIYNVFKGRNKNQANAAASKYRIELAKKFNIAVSDITISDHDR